MRASLGLALLLVLAGCSGGARDVDYTPERGISADIDASRFRGASSDAPGMIGRDEPRGAFSWRLDQR